MSKPADAARALRWWGPLDTTPDGCTRVGVGPLDLLVERRPDEWRIRQREEAQASEDRVTRVACDAAARDAVEWERMLRVGTDTATHGLDVVAKTADLPIVSLPVDPFVLPPRTGVVFYVSTPLWLGLTCGGEVVFETPILAPRQTWVGAPAGPGGPAYANRTQCRRQLDELPVRPHRAISPVAVENRAGTPRAIERLVLSVPYLTLFATASAQLWTERIEIELDGEETESRICPGSPDEASGTEPLAPPREPMPTGRLGRMLAAVL